MSASSEMAASKTLKQFILGNPEVSDDNKSDIYSRPGAAVNSAAPVAADCDTN